jgi:hypothetical protein
MMLISLAAALFFGSCSGAQAPAPPAEAPAGAGQVHANLLQLMRGVFFPNANVLFAAQGIDPAGVSGWPAVENSALALAEAANLLTIPGRNCGNGRPVPLQNADWAMFVQGLRDAGMTAYRAAQSKNPDMIIEASDVLTTACSNCHDVYREKPGGEADRCMQ